MDDIIGRSFGRLKVVSMSSKQRHPKWNRFVYRYRCTCECGNVREVIRTNLITGHTNSCGCLKKRVGENNPSYSGVGEISGKRWSSIRIHAENRSLEFEITSSQAWELFKRQNGRCALTGAKITHGVDASLDRIDNNIGYVSGNIQWVHKDINWMKGSFTTDRFVELCQMVAKEVR